MVFRTLYLLLKCGKEYGHQTLGGATFNDTAHIICAYVYLHEECSQDDIVQALRIDKTTVAKSLQGLETKGYVLRTQDRRDRRKNVLRLTECGRESITEIIAIYQNWIQNVMGVLSPEEQKQFEEYSQRMYSAAQNLLQ